MWWSAKAKEERARKKSEKEAIARALKEASDAAWKEWWVKVKFYSVLWTIGFIALCIGVSYLPRDSAVSHRSPVVSAPIEPLNTAGSPAPKRTESELEKAYEKESGTEIVHRKDGSTYIRKSAGKK